MLRGSARDLERLSQDIAGRVIKDASTSSDSRVYTKVVACKDILYRFYIDHRAGIGTLKIRRNGHHTSA